MLNDSLIERIVQGETNAFGEFHAEMYDRMFYYVFKVLKDKETAEDIVQETFVLFWKRKENFHSLLAVKAFFYVTLRNKMFSLLRETQRHQEIMSKYTSENMEKACDYLVMEAELCGEVLRAIQELPEQTQKVIQYSMQEMTIEEIAQTMHISANTVKTLKKKGYQQLRERLRHLQSWLFFLFVA